MKKRYLHLILILVAILTATLPACIKNDIPYPRIQPNIRTIVAEGQTLDADIDSAQRVVTLHIGEEVNIAKVVLTDITVTPGSHFVNEPDWSAGVDLSKPLHVTLELYQPYVWTIEVDQSIERYFAVKGQVGASVIDVPGRRIIVTLPETANLSAVEVLSAKLGPTGSVCNPPLEGYKIDLTRPFVTMVNVYGQDQLWTIYADVVASTVSTTSVDAWTCVAWVYGSAEEGAEAGFEYRKADTDTWTSLAAEDVTVSNGSLTGCIKHLDPQTEYVVRAVSGVEYGQELTFTTGSAPQLPNHDFENWHREGKIECPWAEGGVEFWGTGNKGAATLGDSNTVPTTDTPTGTGYAAMLMTQWKVVKLAAGSIFSGYYVRTDGTNGVLSFGREFTERPTKVRGMFKYDCKPIDKVPVNDSSFDYLKGQPDTCVVWCALIDSPTPFEIRTKPSDRHLFDPNGSEVIAYGRMACGETVSQYKQFEFELNYKATNRVPKYIIMVGSASEFGDYFVGGVGSTMYLDDLELIYDY